LRVIILTTAVLVLAGCAQQPQKFVGLNGGPYGYNNVTWDQAYNECQFAATQTINSGYGDPFYRAISGGRMLMVSCLQSKGFTPEQPQQ
jgi:hypothetical protein